MPDIPVIMFIIFYILIAFVFVSVSYSLTTLLYIILQCDERSYNHYGILLLK